MSELLNKLKSEQLAARKAKDKVRASVLTTLIGEVSPSGNAEEVDESKILKTIKTFRDNALEMVNLRAQRGESVEEAQQEADIMTEFLPKQLSNEELEVIVVEQIQANDITSMAGMKTIKAYLEENYKGQYDGSAVAGIVKSKVL